MKSEAGSLGMRKRKKNVATEAGPSSFKNRDKRQCNSVAGKKAHNKNKDSRNQKHPLAELSSSVFTFAENEDQVQAKEVAEVLVQTSGSWNKKEFSKLPVESKPGSKELGSGQVYSSQQTVNLAMRESLTEKAESDRVGAGHGSNLLLD